MPYSREGLFWPSSWCLVLFIWNLFLLVIEHIRIESDVSLFLFKKKKEEGSLQRQEWCHIHLIYLESGSVTDTWLVFSECFCEWMNEWMGGWMMRKHGFQTGNGQIFPICLMLNRMKIVSCHIVWLLSYYFGSWCFIFRQP